MSSETKTKPAVERWVFWPAAAVVSVFVAFAMLRPEATEAAFDAI